MAIRNKDMMASKLTEVWRMWLITSRATGRADAKRNAFLVNASQDYSSNNGQLLHIHLWQNLDTYE